MTDLGEDRSGPKESDNRDKSMHGLMVALAMAGIIAGSVILFAYASSDSPVPDGTAGTENEVDLQPEPKPAIAEKFVDEPVYAEKIEYINTAVDVDEPVYVNATTESENEVSAYTEEEPGYVNENEDEQEDESQDADEQDDAGNDQDSGDETDDQELQDIISSRVLDLLNMDDEDDNKNKDKGKGHKGDA